MLELFDAVEWYEARGKKISDAFRRAVDNLIEKIQENPFRFPIAKAPAPRAVLLRYPYSIIFTVSDEEITVVSFFQSSRNPRDWQKRL
jgi:toxin ParE1/3/4